MSLLRKLFFHLYYLGKPPWDTGISPPELLAFINSHASGRALDLGCGTGTNAVTLAQRGWEVTGVDFVRRAIRAAKRRADAAGVRVDFRVGDVTRLDWVTGRFQLVLDIGCFHSLSPDGMRKYVSNLERLLAPGGTFLMYSFIKPPESEVTGLTGEDLKLFADCFTLQDRQMGFDRGQMTSAWFTFVR